MLPLWWRGIISGKNPNLSVELVGGFPSPDDLPYISVYRTRVPLFAFNKVDRFSYRLSSRSSPMDHLHTSVAMYRSAVSVTTGKIDQEVCVIPFLHASPNVKEVKCRLLVLLFFGILCYCSTLTCLTANLYTTCTLRQGTTENDVVYLQAKFG